MSVRRGNLQNRCGLTLQFSRRKELLWNSFNNYSRLLKAIGQLRLEKSAYHSVALLIHPFKKIIPYTIPGLVQPTYKIVVRLSLTQSILIR